MDRMNPDYQRAVSDFVSREVCYCVSELVSQLVSAEFHNDSYSVEELWDVCSRPDYQAAAEEAGWEYAPDLPGNCYRDTSDGQTWACSGWEELCREFDIEPDSDLEAFEHWIVTDWLADKLESHGEMVLRDFLGLTIWGRTTTGQAIALDEVICDIWDSIQ